MADRMRAPLTPDTIVRVIDVDQQPGAVDWRGRLVDFLEVNDFPSDDRDAICAALHEDGVAYLGGGAVPIVKVVAERVAAGVSVWGLTNSGPISFEHIGGAPLTDVVALRLVSGLVAGGINCSVLVLRDGESIWHGSTLPVGPKDVALTTAVINKMLKTPTTPAAA